MSSSQKQAGQRMVDPERESLPVAEAGVPDRAFPEGNLFEAWMDVDEKLFSQVGSASPRFSDRATAPCLNWHLSDSRSKADDSWICPFPVKCVRGYPAYSSRNIRMCGM
jgi:hypothetical protein